MKCASILYQHTVLPLSMYDKQRHLWLVMSHTYESNTNISTATIKGNNKRYPEKNKHHQNKEDINKSTVNAITIKCRKLLFSIFGIPLTVTVRYYVIQKYNTDTKQWERGEMKERKKNSNIYIFHLNTSPGMHA